MYYWLDGSTFVGPEVDSGKYPYIKPETWEDFMRKRGVKDLVGSLFGLSSKE
jgi:hypothetical protein